ncbi:hypothetical protein [Mesonia aestuariivivens]|uniref:Uncharacterized protein n=1 Tax=Mesonia aestuariivivens TaxID=2796128 RepID=A0ABS6W5E0_9FLAO|nr:hypothetical protein [Mesonia aestuariivivens]MBW2962929.1 hypothetical protein [Mesonia aestuariivivens]
MNKKKTSKSVASLAAKTLKNQNASNTAKKLAGSVLSQTKSTNQTGAKLEDLASTVMTSKKYNNKTKTLAGSVLSQSNKKR